MNTYTSILCQELEDSQLGLFEKKSDEDSTEIKTNFPEYSYKETIAIGALVFWFGIVPQNMTRTQNPQNILAEQSELIGIDKQITNTIDSIVKDVEKVTRIGNFVKDNLIDAEEIQMEMEIISDYMKAMRPYIKSQKKKIILYS